MELTDILSIDEWIEFEKSLCDRFRLNFTVYDTSGQRITGKHYFCNDICPVIQSNKNAQTTICATGNQYFMSEAEKTKKALVGECDAGFIKITVPIFLNGEFLGASGGCGVLNEEGEVETFLIQKMVGLKEKEVDALIRGIECIGEHQISRIVDYIEQSIRHLTERYE